MLSAVQMPVQLHATDGVARAVADLQFTLGQGPSVDAAEQGVPVLVADTAEQTDRWPAFCSELAVLNVRALFTFPIRVGEVGLGTLDLYRRAPGALGAGQVAVGVAISGRVGSSLLALDLADGADWDLSLTVHRAAGMLMVQLGTTIEHALVRLRATAFEEGIEVSAVAAQVLEGDRRFAEGPS